MRFSNAATYNAAEAALGCDKWRAALQSDCRRNSHEPVKVMLFIYVNKKQMDSKLQPKLKIYLPQSGIWQ